MDFSDKLINLSARIMLATEKKELLDISSEMTELAKQYFSSEPTTAAIAVGYLQFTKKEIANLPKTLKKEFIANGAVAKIIKRPSGKHSYCYEIRYRRNGYNITASSTNLETAKKKFIEKFSHAIQYEPKTSKSRRISVLANEWLACRKSKIVEGTYNYYVRYYKKYINPIIGDKNIEDIRSAELLELLEQLADKTRAYEEVRSVLNQIFNYAIANGIIAHNPVKLIEYKRWERKSGQAMTTEEIRHMLLRLKEPSFAPFRSAFYLQLYFGLRPCEVSSIQVDGDFIVARNAKRKKGKIEYKRIPIPEEAKGLQFDIVKSPTSSLNHIFQRIFPDKTQYHLRHTFSTVCQQYVRQEIVEIWLGDSPQRLIGKTYTHFPDHFLLSEMQKVTFVPQ